jgi:predicted aconitase with swiveling domain
VVGVFIAPTTKLAVWWRLLSHGAPDNLVYHQTLSGAPATSPDREGSTVGASVFWATGQSGGAPDRSCRLSGAPSGVCLTSTRTVAHLMLLQATVGAVVAVTPLAHRTVRWCTGQSGEL